MFTPGIYTRHVHTLKRCVCPVLYSCFECLSSARTPVLCVHLIRSMLAALGSGGRFVQCPRLRGRVRHPEGCAARQQRDQRHGERRRMRGDICLRFRVPSRVHGRTQAPGAPHRPEHAGGARGVHVHCGGHRQHYECAGRDGVLQARHVFFARVQLFGAYTAIAFMAQNYF